MTIAVVVDSTTDIPLSMREELGITMVPLLILFGNDQFRDGIDMSNDEFYARLVEGTIHPTTSQPSPGDFVEAFERLAKDHDGIISIHLGGELSGTVRSAQQAADMLPDIPVRVIDSRSVSMGAGFLGIEAAKRHAQAKAWTRSRHHSKRWCRMWCCGRCWIRSSSSNVAGASGAARHFSGRCSTSSR